MRQKIEIEIDSELLAEAQKLVDQIRFVSVAHFIEVAVLESVHGHTLMPVGPGSFGPGPGPLGQGRHLYAAKTPEQSEPK